MTPEGLNQLGIDEGFRATVYQDSLGYDTIGYGTLIDARKGGISPDEALAMLNAIVLRNRGTLLSYPWFSKLCDTRKDVIENMVYNMGLAGVLQFKNMIAAIQADDYDKAASEMANSTWARQVGERAVRLEVAMRGGLIQS